MKKYKIGEKITIKHNEDNYLMIRTLFYRYFCAASHARHYTDAKTLRFAQDSRTELFDTIHIVYPVLKKYKYLIDTNFKLPDGDLVIVIYGETKK